MPSTQITISDRTFQRLLKITGKKDLANIINHLIREFLNEQDEINEALLRSKESDLTGDELRSKLNL